MFRGMVKTRILNFAQLGKLLGITREGVRYLWKFGDLPNDIEDVAGRPFWTERRARKLLALRGHGQFAGPPKEKQDFAAPPGKMEPYSLPADKEAEAGNASRPSRWRP